MEATSDPASASERQYEPWISPLAMRGRYCCLISSEAKFMIGSMASLEMRMVTDVEAQPRASSSIAMAWVTMLAPAPP
jgi:hypothetical protein